VEPSLPELPDPPELLPFVAADTPAIPPAVPIAAHIAAIAVVLSMSFLCMVLLVGLDSDYEKDPPVAP